MKKAVFEGLATAIVTPFSGDQINYPVLDELLKRQLDAGVDAIVVCGTTGECATMDDREQNALIAHCLDIINHRCKVIVGTGSNNTKHAAERTKNAAKLGADAVLSVTPYYNKCTQMGLAAHYREIADAADIPVILYNVPSRTCVNILPETYALLAEHPNVVGVKEADPQIAKIANIRSVCPDDFYIWSGNDDMAVSSMAMGAKGLISTASNLYPQEMLRMIRACQSGDYITASNLQTELSPIIDLLFREVNPIPIKAALNLCGYAVGVPRLPLTEASEELQRKLAEYLKNGAE